MTTIAEIFRAFAAEYIARFPHLPHHHRKAIEAICQCRSGALGHTVYHCAKCGATHWIGRACGNRHCPQCQAHKTRQWLERQLDRRLPVPYFFFTFTVPQPLRAFLRAHQQVGYAALFEASAGALKKLARDPRRIGTDLPGFTGVLHTWGRQLPYHPHIHYIIPGGGLSAARDRWLSSRANFYLPAQALSPIYKAIFKERMRREGLLDHIDPQVWTVDWNIDTPPPGDGEHALRYLASYVFRVAISDRRIVSLQDRTLTIRYTDRDSGQERTAQFEVLEFVRRFLQHVLPTGFMKVRHFGFLNPNCSVPLDEIRRLIAEATGRKLAESPPKEETSPFHGPDCGGPLAYVRSVLPFQAGLLDTG
jgi:hypothetical protein